MLQKLMSTDQDVSRLIARLALGVVMFPHGGQKMLGWFGGGGFSGTIEAFGGMGMPAVLAFLIIIGEFFGSLGLIVGFLSRIAGAGIGIIMLGATFIVHFQHGFFMNWYGQKAGEGFEYHILAMGLAVVVTLRGSGPLSVDAKLAGN